MMGKQHVALAVTATSTASILLTASHHTSAWMVPWTDALQYAVLLPIVVLFSLVPDADLGTSTISRAHPVTTSIFRVFFHEHRGASHWLLTAVLFGLAGVGLSMLPGAVTILGYTIPWSRLLMVVLFSSSLAMLAGMVGVVHTSAGHIVSILVFLACLPLCQYSFWPVRTMGAAMALGMALHGVGDMLTEQGLAWLKPFSPVVLRCNINGPAGGEREKHVTAPLLTILAVVTTAAAFWLMIDPRF